MRHLLIRVATITLTVTVPIACARQVEVRTGESPSVATSSIDFTNNLAQAVNVYVRPNSGAGEIFVRQVGPRSHETLSVRGVPPGSSVTLRAAPVDGSVSYTRENVTLGSGFAWQVP